MPNPKRVENILGQLTGLPKSDSKQVVDTIMSVSRSLREGRPSSNLSLVDNAPDFRGGLQITKRFPESGHCQVVLGGPNLVVSQGRRLFSRMISGCAGIPSILRTQQPGLKIIRDTNGSPTTAWVVVSAVSASEVLVQGYTSLSGTPEFSFQFLAGVYTLSALAAAISAVAHWRADVLNSLGSVDAAFLITTPRADCLGDQASYTNGFTSGYSRQLIVAAGVESSITADAPLSLKIDRMRVGTQGHQPAATTLGKDVLMGDEYLTSRLRSSDLGNSAEADNYMPATTTYSGTGQVTFQSVLGTTQGNGLNISEAALVSANDLMVARKNFGQISKTNSFELVFDWTLIY